MQSVDSVFIQTASDIHSTAINPQPGGCSAQDHGVTVLFRPDTPALLQCRCDRVFVKRPLIFAIFAAAKHLPVHANVDCFHQVQRFREEDIVLAGRTKLGDRLPRFVRFDVQIRRLQPCERIRRILWVKTPLFILCHHSQTNFFAVSLPACVLPLLTCAGVERSMNGVCTTLPDRMLDVLLSLLCEYSASVNAFPESKILQGDRPRRRVSLPSILPCLPSLLR